GFSFTTLTHDPEGTTFTFMKMPNPKNQTPKELAHDMADRGANGRTSKMTISSQGTETVAGEELDYVQGESTTSSGTKAEQYLAVITPKGQHEAILLVGVTPGGTYNTDATKELL